MVVDDGLSLLDRGVPGEDARAQACGHGHQADGFQVRIQAGRRVGRGLGRRNWAAITSFTVARSAMLTPAEARARGSLMPHAEVAVVPGSHGGFNRINALNDRIAAFIQAHAAGQQAAQPDTATDS